MKLINERISVKDKAPEAYKAMMKLSATLKKSGLDPRLTELLKIRASQLNSCAFCVDMHTEYALEIGMDSRKIFSLPTWKASHIYTPEERAVLQFTDEMTRMPEGGIADDTYSEVAGLFGEEATAQLIMAIALINSWNRINVAAGAVYR